MVFTDVKDAAHPIVFVNEPFVEMTGFAREAICGVPLKQLLCDVTDAASVAAINEALADKCSGSWEMPCKRSDGSEFAAAVFLTLLHDDSGELDQCFIAIVELDGKVERLIDQRNELHALYNNAPGFIAVTTGPDHRFTFANLSYQKFIRRSDLVGKTVAEISPELVEQGLIDILDEVYRSGDPFVGREVPIDTVDPDTGLRETRYCDFVYQPVRDASDAVTGVFCEGFDVTARRKNALQLTALQAEMIHVSRVNAMGAMAGTLAHELNQPLSAIVNYSAGVRRIVDRAPNKDESLVQALNGLEEASHRAADMIRNLRDLTRRREPARIAFDVRAAVAECVRLVRAALSHDVTLTNRVPEGVEWLADRIQIQQVVINLLSNACKALSTCDRKQVWIDSFEEPGIVGLCISDTGPGVPAEVAHDVFSLTAYWESGAPGMGLPISRWIMDLHRGSIWLEKSSSEGSTFCFSLPRH